jgi:flagellar hook protein FlgE
MSNSNYAISLSGLQNTARAIDTVSNNIANANTVGYKAGEYVFADQFLKAVNPVDFARVGMGSQTLGVRRPNVQGTLVNSANPLDLAISGKGMFRLIAGTPTNATNYPPMPGSTSTNRPAVDPAAVYYTRNGQFGVDKDGYIVNENGMYLTGYQPTGDGTGITDSFLLNYGLLKMPPANLPGRETSYSKISSNLDSSGSAFTTTSGVEFDPTQNTFNNKTTQTIFDYEGNRRTLEVYYRRVTDSYTTITWNGTDQTLTMSPSAGSVPTTPGADPLITINKFSVMRVDTQAAYTNAAAVATSTTALVLDGDVPADIPGIIGTPNSLLGYRVFVNGRDSGVSVGAHVAGSENVTLSSAVDIPKGASISFYPPYLTGNTVNGAPAAGATSFNFGGAARAVGDLVGYRVFVAGVDTGVNVTANTTTGVTLNRPLDAALTNGAPIEFRPALDFTLITPDGTEITVNGSTNNVIDGNDWKFIATSSNVEVYASIDGRFYDKQDSQGVFGQEKSNRAGTLDRDVQGVLGYNPISRLTFLGGTNIDTLVKDPMSGNPLFTTVTRLSAQVQGVGTGITDLVYDLDLTDTTLLPGAFQITSSIQDGEPLSRLSNVTIDNAGRIVGVYGSGKQIYVGQVVLADFTAFEELIPVGKNAFAPSAASGTEASAYGVVLGRAGTGPFGEIKSQALESSNVDLANELVRLMIMQRSYSANSQGLRAVDSTLRDMLDIMR